MTLDGTVVFFVEYAVMLGVAAIALFMVRALKLL